MNEKSANRLLAAFLACAIGSQPCLTFIKAEEDTTLVKDTTAVKDTVAQTMTLSFEQAYAEIGKPIRALVSGATEGITYGWTIDGKLVSSSDSYTPQQKDMQKLITVLVESSGVTLSKDILVSELPVIYINTDSGQDITDKENYINANMRLQGSKAYGPDQNAVYEGAIEVKGRGNSTWGQPKKPYKIKLSDKTNLFNMGKSKHWVLLANYLDTGLMRNTLAYDLSGEMGMYQMQTVWVDVVLNGKKLGNYQFCEQIRIDSERVNIYNWEDASKDCAKAIAKANKLSNDVRDAMEEAMNEDMSWVTSDKFTYGGVTYKVSDYYAVKNINGGYLMELDEYWDEVTKFRTKSGQPINFNTPEFASKDMQNYVQTYLQAFEDAVANHDSFSSNYLGKKVHYTELFDMDSLVDYWLLQEVFFNEENMKKSTYMYKDIDDLFHMGPVWDMDYSANGQGETKIYNEWQTIHYSMNAQKYSWYKDLVKDPYFVLKAQQRYWELHDLFNNMIKENGKIDTYRNYLSTSAAANDSIWHGSGSFNNNVNGLKTWMVNRLHWLDTQFNSKSSILNSFNITQSKNLGVALKNENGQELEKETGTSNTLADALLPYGSSMKVSVSDAKADKVNVYVDGLLAKTSVLNASTTIELAYGEVFKANKNAIIEVRTYKNNSAINSRTFVVKTIAKIDTSALENLISAIEQVVGDGTNYEKDDNWTIFITSLTAAKAIIIKSDATQGEVDDAMNKLMLAYGNIKAKAPVDKVDLKNLIKACKEINTDDYEVGVEEFKAALANAETVYGNHDATQADVDAAFRLLNDAYNGLAKDIVNKTLLEILISTIEKQVGNGDNYQKNDNWMTFVQALTDAKAIVLKEDATQAEVNEAVVKLSDAHLSLNLLPNEEQTMIMTQFLDFANEMVRGNFSKEQLKVIDETVKKVNEMMENFDHKQFDILVQSINEAVDIIRSGGKLVELNVFVERVSKLNRDNYSTGQLKTMDGTLAKVKAMLNDFDEEQYKLLQIEMKETSKIFEDIIIGQPSKPLELLVSSMEIKIGNGDNYKKDDNWTSFGNALANAKKVIANKYATQEKVNETLYILMNAYENIRLLPNEQQLAELNAYMATVNGINRTDFTVMQLKMIDGITKQVQSMIGDFDEKKLPSLQVDIKVALEVISEVQKTAEQVKPVTPPNPGTEESIDGTLPSVDDTKKAEIQNTGDSKHTISPRLEGSSQAAVPNTGDNTSILGALFALLLSGSGVAFLQKRRNRKVK